MIFNSLTYHNINTGKPSIVSSSYLNDKDLLPLTRSDITPGWLAIITEFGLFSQCSTLFAKIRDYIYEEESTEVLPTKSVKEKVVLAISETKFRNNTIICPATYHVATHFANTVGVNKALYKAGIYSTETRIAMLSVNHFKSINDIYKEYEEKINL